MPIASQLNPPVQDDWAVAQKLQVDLATLFDIINRLDIENLHTPGNTFDWNDVQLKNLVNATDSKDAVTLDQLNTAIAGSGHGTGTVTQHGDVHLEGSDRYNFDNSAGGPLVKSYTVTGDQRAALDGAAAPSGANPIATMNDVLGISNRGNVIQIADSTFGPNTAGPGGIHYLPSMNIVLGGAGKLIELKNGPSCYADLAGGGGIAGILNLNGIILDLVNFKAYGGLGNSTGIGGLYPLVTVFNTYQSPATIGDEAQLTIMSLPVYYSVPSVPNLRFRLNLTAGYYHTGSPYVVLQFHADIESSYSISGFGQTSNNSGGLFW